MASPPPGPPASFAGLPGPEGDRVAGSRAEPPGAGIAMSWAPGSPGPRPWVEPSFAPGPCAARALMWSRSRPRDGALGGDDVSRRRAAAVRTADHRQSLEPRPWLPALARTGGASDPSEPWTPRF